jgi:hypothetical protein
MRPSNSPPPDFKAIYFDTNALLGTGWPEPSVLLHNVFVIGGWWGIKMFLPQPVVNEAEEHWLRKLKEQVSRVDNAAKELQRLAKPALCDVKTEHIPIAALREQYRAKRDGVVTEYAIAISPFAKRSVEGMFELATRYVMPFVQDKQGKGFQDAVILASILEHLSTQPTLKAVLITKDEAFGKSNYKDFIGGFDNSRLRIIDLDTVWKELFNPYFDQTVVKPWEQERKNALAAAKSLAPKLKEFLISNLSESMLKPGGFASVVKLLSVDDVRIIGVETPIPDRDTSPDRRVEFTIAVSADCTAIVRKTSLFMTLLNMSQENVGAEPSAPDEIEEKTSWSGGIRATAGVVNRQFQNIVPQSIVSEEELRTNTNTAARQ